MEIVVGSFTYFLIALGVSMATATWTNSTLLAGICGLFWPVTVAFWLTRALHAITQR